MNLSNRRFQALIVGAMAGPWKETHSFLEKAGATVSTVDDGADAIAALTAQHFDVLVVNITAPESGGMELVRQARGLDSDLPIIVITDRPHFETAVDALRHRVTDYLETPVNHDRLMKVIRNTLAPSAPSTGNGQSVAPAASPAPSIPPLLGGSASMQRVREELATVAPHDVTILIQGETGTGKDLVARQIHALSPRVQRGEFYKINCPSIPETLFESEMFGHEHGAFTGAETKRLGRFEMANHGTLFLDEIGLLPLSMQAKLLEVLEYKSFFRVGGNEKLHVDVRIVSATNTPLPELAEAGKFRQDLMYRLQVCAITLPPLRERTEDIPELLEFLLHKYAKRFGLPVRSVPTEYVSKLMHRTWPGNVRELDGLAARFALQDDLSVFDEDTVVESGNGAEGANRIVATEARMLKAALVETGWNQREAAKSLGLSYSAFRRRLYKHGICRPGYTKSSLRFSANRVGS